MAIVFNGNNTKRSPEAFPGVVLQSFIHPEPAYNDGYDANVSGIPEVGFSFGLFTVMPNQEWPLTKFDLSEVAYILEGDGVFICGDKQHAVKPGFVIYISKGETRIIKNTGNRPLRYLCIVDPAWKPEYEHVLAG